MNDQLSEKKTRNKIICTALEIIEREGFQGITVRKIASEAGVNVAAVNYHFGNKENLISEVLSNLTSQLKDTFDLLKDETVDAELSLSNFIFNYMNVIANYPDMIKSLMIYAVQDKPLQGHAEYSVFLQTEGIALISKKIKTALPHSDDFSVSLKALNLLSGLSMPYLMGNSIKKMLNVNLFDEKAREIYAKLLLHNITN